MSNQKINFSADGNRAVIRTISEIWDHRDLLLILAYRDLRVRYAQTFLGIFWAFIQPAATLLIFYLVFGRAVKVDTGIVPYAVFAVSGMVPWSYFSFVMNQAGGSVIGAQEMIKKVYFPRLVIPLSKAIVGMVDFTISFLILVVFVIVYKVELHPTIIYIPVFLLLTIVASVAVGVWLSALSIRYRDIQHVIPFMIQFGLYCTPVAYPTSLLIGNVPRWVLVLYYLNPMAGIVDGFRWALLDGEYPTSLVFISYFMVFLLLVSGMLYFRRMERVMADLI